MIDFAEMANMEIVTIVDDTDLQSFKNELRWNEVFYHLAQGLHG
jgi:L-arabinose isomerase